MKKALLGLCLTIGLILFAIAFWPMQHLVFSEIPVLSAAEFEALVSERTDLFFSPHSLFALSEPLPYDEEANTWYTPALTNDVSVRLPRTWRIARTDPDTSESGKGTYRLILYTQSMYAVCTLIETGLPIIDIQLQRFDLDPQYISSRRINANAVVLSQQADGHLLRETNRVQIKIRGGSSLNYPKRSYTLFFLDTSGRSDLHAPLGLPADRKFALNSLYEDDSKIRDALAYKLWAELEPDNALQFTYTELLINDSYFGLYGMHNLPTENSLHASDNDVIYKINSHLWMDPTQYAGQLPSHEIAFGIDPDKSTLSKFFEPLIAPSDVFPAVYDMDSFINYAIQMEMLAVHDNTLKNMVITHMADTEQFRLTAWDMDLSFGAVWDETHPLLSKRNASSVNNSLLTLGSDTIRPISILYAACPDFREAVAARYRELRETVFSDEFLLEQAAALYDPLTDCGARARDAARWPNSAVSEDNSFIEQFIPARMAFLDREFAAGTVLVD